MATVTYTGIHAEVEVPSLGIIAQRGAAIEVDDDAAEALCQQEGVWTRSAPAGTDKNKGGK